MINDWIMRQIELMAQGLAKLFNIEQSESESTIQQTVADYVERTIKKNLVEQLDLFLAEKNLCEAEDLLFACKEQFPNIDFTPIGKDMYSKMQIMTDEDLIKCNFPRGEIQDGLDELLRIIAE